MSEKSDAWQLVVVGVSDQFVADERDLDQDDIEQDDLDRDDTEHDNSPNPCRDAKMLAKSAMLLGLCSEPVVFAKRSPMDEHDQLELQTALIEKLTKAAKKMKEKNINKMMVYYADHGRRTVSVDLDLLLEEAVVSAVEENELQYVCVIAPCLSWSAFHNIRGSTTTKPLQVPPKDTGRGTSLHASIPKAINRMVEVAGLFFAERPFFAPGPAYPKKTCFLLPKNCLGSGPLKVTPPSSSQLQMTAPKPQIPRLAKCMVASLFNIARCPAYCRGVHRFFACWY